MDWNTATLTELQTALRSGVISAVDLLEVHIATIEAVNPTVNGMVADRFARARARRPRARTIRARASWCRTSVVVCGSSDANRARRIESNQKKRVTFLELLCVLRFARDATVSRRARGVVARVRACAARASERTLTSLRRGHANLLCIFFQFIRCHIRR